MSSRGMLPVVPCLHLRRNFFSSPVPIITVIIVEIIAVEPTYGSPSTPGRLQSLRINCSFKKRQPVSAGRAPGLIYFHRPLQTFSSFIAFWTPVHHLLYTAPNFIQRYYTRFLSLTPSRARERERERGRNAKINRTCP